MVLWIMSSGLLLTLAYEYGSVTSIIGTYVLFAIGLIYLNTRSNRHITKSLYNNAKLTKKEIRRKAFEQACGYWGAFLGVSTGFIALVVGLVNSGRLTL